MNYNPKADSEHSTTTQTSPTILCYFNRYSNISLPYSCVINNNITVNFTGDEAKNVNPNAEQRLTDKNMNGKFLLPSLMSLKEEIIKQACPMIPKATPKMPQIEDPKLEDLKIFMNPRMVEAMKSLFNEPRTIGIINQGIDNKKLPDSDGEKYVGAYTRVERKRRIMKYKEKQKKWRKLHPLSRNFEGRRRIAFEKVRKNGKFTKPNSLSQSNYTKRKHLLIMIIAFFTLN